MSGSPHRDQKPYTPLSNKGQVWDMRGIGIREPEKRAQVVKWKIKVQLFLGDNFRKQCHLRLTLQQLRATVQNFANSWTEEEKCPGRPGYTPAEEPRKCIELQGSSM